MGDGLIGEALPDHRHAMPGNLLDHIWAEDAACGFIEHLGAVEGGFLGGEDVLRDIAAVELGQIGAELLHAVGHLEMRGHRIHAEHVAQLHHRLTLGGMRHPRALPGVTAIEQNGVGRPGLTAQAADQGGEMRETAEPSELL